MANNVALVVGIDYKGTDNELPGCGNDARDIAKLLNGNGFKSTVLTDAKEITSDVRIDGLPNKDLILGNLKTMIANAKPGDTIMFYNSSHGYQDTSATNSSEQDYIVALDAISQGWDQSKMISSTELHNLLIQVPQGVKLLMVSDSCFSGNIPNLDVNVRALAQHKQFVPFAHLHALLSAHPRSANSHGDITFIAGCRSDEESTDLGYNGALTYAIKDWIAKSTFSKFMSTCFDYATKALSDLKAALTKTIKDKKVDTQDPQISYDKATGPAPVVPVAPIAPVTPVHPSHPHHKLGALIAELVSHFEGNYAGKAQEQQGSEVDVDELVGQPAAVTPGLGTAKVVSFSKKAEPKATPTSKQDAKKSARKK
ncbi:MAG: caspase family protein [Proteobacteria bacterium]|nr:caspase family protein [Pseudomonadota bacterium]